MSDSGAVFQSTYAGAYDALYGDKDYAAECDLVQRVLTEHAAAPVRSLLDLGCGTGSHAVPLAQRGYQVHGIDLSAEMLAIAWHKAAEQPGVAFSQGDVRDFDLGRTFDAALMLFAVLGYQTSNGDVLNTLRSVRRHLQPGGLFFFDVWYGPAVLAERPSQRVKTVDAPDGSQVLRAAGGELDTARQTCTVTYDLWRFQAERVVDRTHEAHQMRYFFPQELRLFLDVAGFDLVHLGAFPDFDRPPTDHTWNIAALARARE